MRTSVRTRTRCAAVAAAMAIAAHAGAAPPGTVLDQRKISSLAGGFAVDVNDLNAVFVRWGGC